jgi:PKD repeat protein
MAPSPTTTATPGPSSVLKNPVCQSLSIDRSTSGVAPYSVTFTAVGNDPDGVITKAQFNFGDGPVVTETVGGGLGTSTINLQKSHTYQNNGTYTATVTFQDNQNNYSGDNCKVTITMGGGGTPQPTTPHVGSTSPYPTQPPKGSSPTPTPLTVLPPTGLPQDIVTMTVVGSAVALIGSFLVIFLW